MGSHEVYDLDFQWHLHWCQWLEGQWSEKYQAVRKFGRLLMTISSIRAWSSLISVIKQSHGIWLPARLVTAGVTVIRSPQQPWFHPTIGQRSSLPSVTPFPFPLFSLLWFLWGPKLRPRWDGFIRLVKFVQLVKAIGQTNGQFPGYGRGGRRNRQTPPLSMEES